MRNVVHFAILLLLLPGAYQEAPILAARVKRGELPVVEQRLPERPAVVQPVKSIGQYGGTWRRLAKAKGDMGLNSRLGYETLLHWNRTATAVLPGIAERWEMSDDATTFTFHLRKGMKWSDGHPFTSEDFYFTHHHRTLDKELTDVPAPWLVIGGKVVKLKTPDKYTVVMRFSEPYGLFPEMLCYRGSMLALCLPKHYMKQFHPSYADRAKLLAEAKEAGFVNIRSYFGIKANLEENPQLPSINPFVCKTPFPAPRCLAVRNPYYWKVDPQGRQLPYIDEISYVTVFDVNVLNMKAMNGDVDFQARQINAANYTLFMESRTKAHDPKKQYRVHLDSSPTSVCIYINQHSRDERLRPLLKNRDFRRALSLAVNRDEINDMVFSGLGVPTNAVGNPYDWCYIEGMDQQNIEYDPKRANELLDELGMKRGLGGWRRMPDGSPFHQLLHVFPSEAGSSEDLWLLISEYWRELGLRFIVKHEDGALSSMQVIAGNSDFWAYAIAGVHWELDGLWFAPISPSSYYAPLYGRYYYSQGKAGVPPPPEHQQLVDWYHEMKSTPSREHRKKIGQQVLQRWAERCYIIGVIRPPEVFIISKRFRNVPDRIIQDYRLMSPGYIGIEQFYIDSAGENH